MISSKTVIKHTAQDELLHYMQSAYLAVSDDTTLTAEQRQIKIEALDKQILRVKKLFGLNILQGR